MAIFYIFLGFIVLIILSKYWRSRKLNSFGVCKTCRRKISKEFLLKDDNWRQIEELCRDHILQKYRTEFLISPFKIVAVEFMPIVAGKPTRSYTYYPSVQLTSFFHFKKEDKDILKILLDSIDSEKCQVCNDQASVLFVSRGTVSTLAENDRFLSQSFLNSGKYLCKKHALEEFIPGLQHFSGELDGGFYLPYKSDGILMPDCEVA